MAMTGWAAVPGRISPAALPHEGPDVESTGFGVKAFNAAYYAELKRWTKVARDAGLKAN